MATVTAYAQWVIIVINNVGTAGDFEVRNLSLKWGKLHADGDKDREVNKNTIEGKPLSPDDQIKINSCGKSDAASGTEGSFDLWDKAANKAIRHVYWNCPWGSKTNAFTVSGGNTRWLVEHSGENLYGGSLGTITVDVLKKRQ